MHISRLSAEASIWRLFRCSRVTAVSAVQGVVTVPSSAWKQTVYCPVLVEVTLKLEAGITSDCLVLKLIGITQCID